VIFPQITSIKKTDCPLLQKELKRTRKTVTLEAKMLGYCINNYGERWKNKTIGTETTKLRPSNISCT